MSTKTKKGFSMYGKLEHNYDNKMPGPGEYDTTADTTAAAALAGGKRKKGFSMYGRLEDKHTTASPGPGAYGAPQDTHNSYSPRFSIAGRVQVCFLSHRFSFP